MNTRITRTASVALLGAAAVGVSMLAGTTATAQPTASTGGHTMTVTKSSPGDRTYLIECVEENLRRAPRTFDLTCADANMRLTQLKWKNWGAKTATATGKVAVNTCSPSCDKGKWASYAVKVSASKLAMGETARAYQTLTVTSTGKRPAGTPRVEVFKLPGFDGVTR